MKLNLSGWYYGKIGLEGKVIDFSRLEVRPQITSSDLENHYDWCVTTLQDYSEYFADQDAFHKTVEHVAHHKPELVALDPVYPGFNFRHRMRALEHLLHPGEEFDTGKYFYVPQCAISFPKDVKTKPPLGDIESVIKIPNNFTQVEAKISTIHEALHYILFNYRFLADRPFTSEEKYASIKERVDAEHGIEEVVVEYLTEVLLERDKEALLENRWKTVSIWHPVIRALGFLSAGATGVLIAKGLFQPSFLPLVIAPTVTKSLILKGYKHFKREELTIPREHAELKI